ncbi:DUF6302 family protein [Streptomyces sp. NPDC001165]|uniref:DUF6302 family protein n=1 Tax=Streptomyces sp. NPDC001165 TaxID=3364546 RepID=UPI00369BB2F5
MSLSRRGCPDSRSCLVQALATEDDEDEIVRPPSPGPQILEVRLLPPEEAHDFEHWARRLVHTDLLRDAVAVAVYRVPLLAVPVGPGRRGGRLHMLYEEFAAATARALVGRQGFAPLSISGAVVEWGDRPPPKSDLLACQQFYGLRHPAEERGGDMRPPAGHGGYGSESGRWPPAAKQPTGLLPPVRETVPTVAATGLP